jgi:hypothetical protein
MRSSGWKEAKNYIRFEEDDGGAEDGGLLLYTPYRGEERIMAKAQRKE